MQVKPFLANVKQRYLITLTRSLKSGQGLDRREENSK